MNLQKRIFLLVGFLSVATVASAHHSRSHYVEETSALEGELLSVAWHNPHAGFTLSVTNDAGEQEVWRLESWGSPYVMSRMGVTKKDFVVGSRIRVAGRVSRKRSNDMLLTHIMRADGTEVVMAPNIKPYWQGSIVGGGENWRAGEHVIATTEEENRGIFRVWSIDRLGQYDQYYPYTADAVAARETWDELESFVVSCEQRGMPAIMRESPYPIELIEESPDTIIIRGNYYDVRRTIHLRAETDPNLVPPSHLGYSVGRWEGETLVVETTRIDWPHFDTQGTPQSESIEVVERFTLGEDPANLYYEIVITDPSTFTAPAYKKQNLLALGEMVEPFDCAPGF